MTEETNQDQIEEKTKYNQAAYRKYHATHQELCRQRSRDYNATHKEDIAENFARYYAENKEKHLEYLRQYHEKNRELLNAKSRERYHRKKLEAQKQLEQNVESVPEE